MAGNMDVKGHLGPWFLGKKNETDLEIFYGFFFLEKLDTCSLVVVAGPWKIIITPSDLHVLTHNYWKIYNWFVSLFFGVAYVFGKSWWFLNRFRGILGTQLFDNYILILKQKSWKNTLDWN